MLLLFVEILYLVEVQQHAAGGQQRVELGDDLLYIGKPGGRRVQLAQGAVRFFGDNACDGGLSRARRTVEYHVGYAAAFDYAPQQAALPEYMSLADNIIEAVRPYFVCERLVHLRSSGKC